MTETKELVVEANERASTASRVGWRWSKGAWYLRVRMPSGDALMLYGLREGENTWWYWAIESDLRLYSRVEGGSHQWFLNLTRGSEGREAADLILATATLMGILE